MKVIADQNMEDTVVQMDGHHFENCTITRSVLIFGGGDFSWTNSRFINCQIRLIGPAKRAIDFLKNFGLVPQQASDRVEAAGSSSVH